MCQLFITSALSSVHQVWFQELSIGTNTYQYIDVKKVAQMLGADKCKALPGLHAFTGCDTVSAFAGRGKLKGLGLISKSAQHREALTLLGSHWDITDDLHKKLESFTCQLYCCTLVESVNDLRYDLFLAKKGNTIMATPSMLFVTS